LEDAMKTLRLLAIGFAISATAAACSPSQHQLSILEDSLSGNEASKGFDIRMIEKSYLACLGSGNPGEVESALDHVIYMRIAFPDEDLREIKMRLFDLATRGYTTAIRYKAYVAIQVFADPQAFREVIKAKHITGDEFLAELASHFDQ